MPPAGAKLGEEANMKNFLKLFALLSCASFAQSTQKYDQYLSRAAGTPTLLKAQAATAAGSGATVSLLGGDAFGAGNIGGNVIISGGAGGAGAAKGQLLLNTLLKFNTAVDAENGHIRNSSNTAVFIPNQSTSSVFAGAFSGNFTASGGGNSAFGNQSMSNVTSGANNTALGSQAMQQWTDGSDNVAAGHLAIGNSSSGDQNVALGSEAMRDATNAASGNVAAGYQAGQTVDSIENTIVGYSAGTDVNPLTTGASNTFLGARSGLATAAQHSFMSVIGANAKGECDNCVILGRTTDFTGIGLLDPSSKLHVDGEIRIGTSAAYVGLNVVAPTSYSVTLPAAAPAVGQVLTATSATALAWSTPGGAVSPLVPLIADNQIVDVTGFSSVIIASDDPVAANRTFTITNPAQGQQITFVSISSDQAELLDNSVIASSGGLMRLSGDWFPSLNSTLTVVCNDSSGLIECYETSRSSN